MKPLCKCCKFYSISFFQTGSFLKFMKRVSRLRNQASLYIFDSPKRTVFYTGCIVFACSLWILFLPLFHNRKCHFLASPQYNCKLIFTLLFSPWCRRFKFWKNWFTNTFSFRKWKRQFKFLLFEEVLSWPLRINITINRKIFFFPALLNYNFYFASKTYILDQVSMVISCWNYLTIVKYCFIDQTGQDIFPSIQTGMSDDSQMIVWRQRSKFVCSGQVSD